MNKTHQKNRRWLVRKFISLTDGWNKEFHDAIEENVFLEYHKLFPTKNTDDFSEGQLEERRKQIEKMREFYYQRMVQTSSLLIGGISILIAIIALIISVMALFS
ncbi:hypothetical protein [Serratia quinivorans]|uniref:hypothetical protein n=1 Tax=Serratia quinivorans TaxID=137545 RepID=UPI00217A13D7|nr:hypothetical protein [Serratia quinivorans]CAI2035430.1 Uncharacterised protein [Serratia quinivorans]